MAEVRSGGAHTDVLTSAREAVESHLMAFAAEEADSVVSPSICQPSATTSTRRSKVNEIDEADLDGQPEKTAPNQLAPGGRA